MLASLKIDGTNRLAIVLDENYSYGAVAETQKALVELVEILETEQLESDISMSKMWVLTLAKNMGLTQDQAYGMLAAYFADKVENVNTRQTKTCEITF